MNKLIFLDIDGVLNNTSFQKEWIEQHKGLNREYLEIRFEHLFVKPTEMEFYNGYIVPKNLENFNSIIDATNADIVLSSDWRFINDGNYNNLADIDLVRRLFEVRGIKGNVIGATPYIFKHPRDIEILRYINTNKIKDTKIVVIDDLREAGEAIRDIPDSLFIWTNYNTGLTKEEADKAIEFLNK
jgi:hypothetical protein